MEQVKKIIKYNEFNRNAMTTDGYSSYERDLAYGITMVNYLGLNLIYDELKTSLRRIPTQDEYIKDRIKELYPDYLIYSSTELDTCGVDLLLVHNITKEIELIHVSSDKNLGNKKEIANIRFRPNGNRYILSSIKIVLV